METAAGDAVMSTLLLAERHLEESKFAFSISFLVNFSAFPPQSFGLRPELHFSPRTSSRPHLKRFGRSARGTNPDGRPETETKGSTLSTQFPAAAVIFNAFCVD